MLIVRAPTFTEDWGDVDPKDIGEVYTDSMWTHYKFLWWVLDPRMAWRDFQWNDIPQLYEGWAPALGVLKNGEVVRAAEGSLSVDPPYDTVVTAEFLAVLRAIVEKETPPNIKQRHLDAFDRMISFINLKS